MVRTRGASGAAVAALVSMVAASCRCSKGDGEAGDPAAEASAATDEEREGTAFAAALDASRRFLDASPRVDRDLEGPVDAVCTGREVAFAAAVVDPRCAIDAARAKALRAALEREGGVPVSLRQEASLEPDGRIRVRLVNAGPAPLTLPLSWAAKLPSFTVLAEDERHSIFELAPPRFDVAVGAAGDRPRTGVAAARAYFARIVLPPGGAAFAIVAPDVAVIKALRRVGDAGAVPCTDGGVCGPARLTRGRYMLHVGELLTDVEAGPPASVTWDAP